MSSTAKRSTIYFDPSLHKAMQLKALETSRSMSELVNEAIRLSLSEDAADLAVFKDRKHESTISFEKVLEELQKNGKL